MAQFRTSEAQPCGFCKHSIAAGDPHKYVYPVPRKLKPAHVFEGAISCMKCYPNVRAAQREEGVLLDATQSRFREEPENKGKGGHRAKVAG